MATKANHHFIPQLYLRGFADGVGRKARVFAFDSETKTTFKTLVRNVGSRRHFFRIEVDGVDPNYLEDAMAEVEGEIASHLAEVIVAKSFPTSNHFNSVMNLLANVSLRNPRLRGNIAQFHRDIAQWMTRLSLSSKERWDSQVSQMREEGAPLKEDISFEDMKRFIESDDYETVINQTYLIGLELKMIEPVLECLARRNWCFVTAPEGHQYICSDDPVVLSWTENRETRPYSPGHGLGGTLVTFPLSSELLLMGTFEELPEHLEHAPFQVLAVNTRTARYSTKQIYARDGSFMIDLPDRSNVRGEELPHFFDQNARPQV